MYGFLCLNIETFVKVYSTIISNFEYTRPLRYGEYIKVKIGSEYDYETCTVIVSDTFIMHMNLH